MQFMFNILSVKYKHFVGSYLHEKYNIKYSSYNHERDYKQFLLFAFLESLHCSKVSTYLF